MMNATEFNTHAQKSLEDFGIALFSPLFSPQVIQQWRNRIDEEMRNVPDGSRNYLYANDLLRLGILDELFNETFCSTITALMPDAAIYHLHYYEIEGNNDVSHVHSTNGLAGWHRDDYCFYACEKENVHFFSFFIYLSDVDELDGPFEIAGLRPDEPIYDGAPSYKAIGKAGTNFIFDRTYWHRATPNRSANKRKVIKLSFQDHYLPNERINFPEFDDVRKSALCDNPLIHKWFHHSNQIG